jgi:uncharacterized membrane protein YhaH (DUF805 family)
MQWYVEVLRKYAVFEGRAHRTEFWMFVLVNFAISIALNIVDYAIGTDGEYIGLLSGVYAIAVLIPSLAVGARRLHDTGRTAWWLLLELTIVGIIVLIVFWAMEGEKGPNEHGPNPWEAPQPV